MNILITGGTGFIGTRLTDLLISKGHQIWILTRQKGLIPSVSALIYINNLEEIDPQEHIHCLINLAGAPLFDSRWSSNFKAKARESRIKMTQTLLQWVKGRSKKPDTLISGSAVGFYGNGGAQELSEDTPQGHDFAAKLCLDWENTALEARELGIRVCLLRTGLVLGSSGGALKKMLPGFKLGLGSALGNGQQYWPWIHLDDHVHAVAWLAEHKELEGAFNLTAPTPVTNHEFSKTLATTLGKPMFLPPVPKFVLSVALGESCELLTYSQRVMPNRLLNTEGYIFKFPTLECALTHIFES